MGKRASVEIDIKEVARIFYFLTLVLPNSKHVDGFKN